MVQRFLKLLATVADPAEILAITFTRKATAELHDRIVQQLEAAVALTPTRNPFEDATRQLALAVLAHDALQQWHLLDNPNHLNIRSIDSFAAQIAATHSVVSTGGATYSPTEDAPPLYAEAARRTLMQLGGLDPSLSADLETVLLHRDNNLPDGEALIAEMLSLREQWTPLIPAQPDQLTDVYLDQHVLPRLERALDLEICRALTILAKAAPPQFLEDLCTLAADMGHAEGYKGAPSPIAICAGSSGLPAQTAAGLERWHALISLLLVKDGKFRAGFNRNHVEFEITRPHRDELERLLNTIRDNEPLRELLCRTRDLPSATYPPAQWQVAKPLFRVLHHALFQLEQVFAETSTCDFTQIALRAADALRNPDSDDLPPGSRLQHLLVDEMQDTSASQYQLIQLLTQHWDGASQTLFLVGDPRQSIYLFRQARVERFIKALRTATLGGPDPVPLGVLRLTANFRSQQRLVESFNHDFARIFPPAPQNGFASPDLLPYTPAEAVRPPAPTSPDSWHTTTRPTVPPTEQAAVHRRQARSDAREIRSIVASWQARPLPPGRSEPWRIAVLVAARTHLLPIVRAFRQSSTSSPIPYRALRVEPLRERQEILDLLALTRVLLHPADRTAWLALLRTPWCGLALADLHHLAGPSFSAPGAPPHTRVPILKAIEHALAEPSAELSPEALARLRPFHAILTSALVQRGRLPLSQWISRTWHAFGPAPFADPASLTNVERFFALIDELTSTTGLLDLAELNRRLDILYAAPSLDPRAVDLTTIHLAKGLEWDVVLVPALERPLGNNRSRLLSWIEIEPRHAEPDSALPGGHIAPGILAPIISRGGDKDRLQQWIWNTQVARIAAERKRLFYVACTRAQEELHLFASVRTRSNDTLEAPPASLLSAAWPAAEPHFDPPPAAMPAPVLEMPRPAPLTLERVAAGAPAEPASAPPPRIIERLPLTAFALPSTPSTPPAPHHALFSRPEGSFSARATGNALHTFLESLAARIAAGESLPALRSALPGWRSRVAAVLRASGLAPADIERLTPAILRGLRLTLEDPAGRWLLAPHPAAASESSLLSPEDATAGIRLDRTFLAGATPGSTGSTHLWIIDYKTSTHATQAREAFLAKERLKYSPQLETYARRLAPAGHPIRLALYYPLLPALDWWPPEL